MANPEDGPFVFFHASPYSPGFLFGREGFEGGSLPASFDSTAAPGNSTITAVTTGNGITGWGTYNVKITNAAGGLSQASARKNLGAVYTELWIQKTFFLTAPFVFNSGAFFTNLITWDAALAANPWYAQLEDDGVPNVTFNGNCGYINTAKAIPVARRNRVEYYIKISATVGRIKLWINNTVAGSPDYDSGNINTGTTGIQYIDVGNAALVAGTGQTSNWYLDDVCVDTAFIGNR